MQTGPSSNPTYTAISFAPVQSFIEKSRKLRDLFGASLILSHLSYRLVEQARATLGEDCVISPGLIDAVGISEQEGMPNRVLIKGEFSRNDAAKTLLSAWGEVLDQCRNWIENEAIPKELLPSQNYFWEQEWTRWKRYTWEIFWGHDSGKDDPIAAMRDLERRKLRRDWIGINWTGESSSLTGTDAIAWPRLGEEHTNPGRTLTEAEKEELENFYWHLAWILDDPNRRAGNMPPDRQQLKQAFQEGNLGRYVAPNERLSIPELVKRLVTWPEMARRIGMSELEDGFRDVMREPGYWTGWFMGDGDRVGDKITEIASTQRDEGVKNFSQRMRQWGRAFQANQAQFTQNCGRVIYAGGDDFLGVIFSDDRERKVETSEALNWFLNLPRQWQKLQQELRQSLKISYTYSVGFVWASHAVPQRDILQHCREAERQAKNLGRNRITIRVVFNSGQFIQWTCPWDYLDILIKYRDRDGKSWDQNPNWNHVYNDWTHLKARHTIRLQDKSENIDDRIALALFDLYFPDKNFCLQNSGDREQIIGGDSPEERNVIQWIDGLITVGWQLCSDS